MPALNAGGGNDFIGRPEGWGKQVRDACAAGTAKWPEWKPGSEFKARRDKMLGL